jgi:prepilin-type N-terminal cleavage/methylation domain-containing protein
MTNRDAIRDDAGFTLVELLVTLVLIGILTGIAVTTFVNQRGKASGATAISDLRNAATAEEAQLGDSGGYVASPAALAADGFRRSPNTALGIAVSAVGYCAVAGHAGTYWWFDSAAGGLQSATTNVLAPPATATGVCRTTAPTTVS